MYDNTEIIKMPSGYLIKLSTSVYADYFLSFNEAQEILFYNFMQSGHYFPQIMQFIFVIIGLCTGYTSFGSILLFSLSFGIVSMILWFLLKLHIIPGINVLCNFFGQILFKFKMHLIVVIILAFSVADDWKVILYYIAASLLTGLITIVLFSKLSTVKYNDRIAIMVSQFNTNIRNM